MEDLNYNFKSASNIRTLEIDLNIPYTIRDNYNGRDEFIFENARGQREIIDYQAKCNIERYHNDYRRGNNRRGRISINLYNSESLENVHIKHLQEMEYVRQRQLQHDLAAIEQEKINNKRKQILLIL